MRIVETLITIKDKYNVDILSEDKKVLGMLCDLMPVDKKDLRRIKTAYDSGAVNQLRIHSSNPDTAFRKACYTLCEMDISPTAAVEIVSLFVNALGWNLDGTGDATTLQKRKVMVPEQDKRGWLKDGTFAANEQNVRTTLEKLKRDVARGLAYAENDLGSCYYNGIGVEQDYNEAFRLIKSAASKGLAIAQFNLGSCYADGHGTDQDYEEAVKWYKKAAEQGEVDAQHSLAECYEIGQGVSKDDIKAFEWYKKAARKGHPNSQASVALAYNYGIGVKEDAKKAVKWYKKAAEQGNITGQYGLGFCYEEGKGINQDLKKALY